MIEDEFAAAVQRLTAPLPSGPVRGKVLSAVALRDPNGVLLTLSLDVVVDDQTLPVDGFSTEVAAAIAAGLPTGRFVVLQNVAGQLFAAHVWTGAIK